MPSTPSLPAHAHTYHHTERADREQNQDEDQLPCYCPGWPEPAAAPAQQAQAASPAHAEQVGVVGLWGDAVQKKRGEDDTNPSSKLTSGHSRS